MRLRRYLAVLATCASVGVGARAYGQTFGATAASIAQGSGIRLGDTFVLHLGLGSEVDYDSNVFYEANNPTQAAFLRLNPSFLLTNKPRQGERPILFSFHGGLNYVEYLTGDPSLSKHRQFNVDAGLMAAFFTTSPYNFVLFDNYVRSTQPPYTAASENLNRDTNEVGARINLAPGGGRLVFNVGYLFGIDYFELNPLDQYDVQYHRLDLRASWKFLPKTAVYIAADETIYRYVNTTTTSTGLPTHVDGYPFNVVAGLQGLVTSKLTVNLWVGYGNGFYVSGPSPNTAVGGLALTWKPTILSAGSIGYQHDFRNSLLGTYYDEDTAYVSWTQLIWRFTGFIRFQYSNLRFKGVQPEQATTDGTDNYITLNVRVDYPFREWLIASVGYDLYFNRSDRMLTTMAGAVPGVVPVDYTKNVVYLRLTLQY